MDPARHGRARTAGRRRRGPRGPPASSLEDRRDAPARARFRAEQRDAVIETVGRYNPEAVICVGVPFGHTRPQWIVPHGGTMTLDGASHRITASYA